MLRILPKTPERILKQTSRAPKSPYERPQLSRTFEDFRGAGGALSRNFRGKRAEEETERVNFRGLSRGTPATRAHFRGLSRNSGQGRVRGQAGARQVGSQRLKWAAAAERAGKAASKRISLKSNKFRVLPAIQEFQKFCGFRKTKTATLTQSD